jgi:hypothetical protein
MTTTDAISAAVRRPMTLIDHSKPEEEEDVRVEPGVYTLARIPNPYGYDGNWLVIEGTTTGMTEEAWLERSRWESRPYDLVGVDSNV